MARRRSHGALGAALGGLLLLSTAVVPARAGDWPQWLGPERSGVSKEKGLLTGWPEAGGPPVLWRRKLGAGLSSISVAGDTAYTMAAMALNEFVVALDVKTGEERWRFRTDLRYEDPQGGDGPRSTPTLAADRVVAFGAGGKLWTLDRRTGKPLWTRDVVKELGGVVPKWGYSASPLVDGGLVWVDAGGRDGYGIVAFRLDTGAIAHHSGDFDAGYSSPVRFEAAGFPQIVFFAAEEVVSVSPSDGRVLWTRPWKTSWNVHAATPVLLPGDRVLVASGYGVGAAVLHVTSPGGKPRADDVWKKGVLRSQMATPLHHDGTIYGFDGSRLAAVDAATGREHWNEKGWGRGTALLVDGYLVVLSEDGRLGVVEATPKGYVETRAPVQVLRGTNVWTVPALANGVLYLRDPNEVVAMALGTR